MYERDHKLLVELNRKVVSWGYQDLKFFLAENLHKTLKELSVELGVSYHAFRAFHARFIEQFKES